MIEVLNLNENWKFTMEDQPSFAFEANHEAETVTLPHSWNHTDGQGGNSQYLRKQCWYQRYLTISPETLEKRLYLEIGAAGNIGKVYVNGQLAAESRCGYSMFRVPLNPFVKAGDNFISIAVDNSYNNEVFPLMADFTFYGGLYRDVKLLVMEDIHFDVMDLSREGIYLTPRKMGNESFELEISGTVVVETSDSVLGTIAVQLSDQEGNAVLETSTELKIRDKTPFSIKEQISNPILWDGVENPYLYTASVSIIVAGEIYDSRQIEIGFRTIEVTADRGVLLNGKAIKLNGVSRHQDYAGVGNAVTRHHMEEDMNIIKEVGANSIRLAHYQHDDYFYTLCDRYGMLVWAEIPFISAPSSKDPENKNAMEQLERLIKQAYNHTSIYCWGIQNEITIATESEQLYDTIRRLEAAAKQLDPTRITSQANIYSVENDSTINDLTDMVGYNLYYGWYYGEMEDLGVRMDEFHKVKPQVPVLISEYGVDTNPRFHSYTPRLKDYTEEYQLLFHHNAIKTINDRAYILGGYVWNMFDFGSASRDEGGEKGKNLKGLVTLDRKIKKDAFYLYKAYWSKESFVHIAGRRFVNRHEAENDIVILTNIARIKVYVQDQLLAEIESEDRVKIVENVLLELGENRIRVEAIDEQGKVHFDEIVVRHVAEADKEYIYVPKEEKRHVVNWFEKYDLTNVQEVELKEGYYSTFDTIEDLYSNEAAKAVFKSFFGDLAESPRFEVMRGVMSIEKLSKLSWAKIPKELLPVINKELNAIRK